MKCPIKKCLYWPDNPTPCTISTSDKCINALARQLAKTQKLVLRMLVSMSENGLGITSEYYRAYAVKIGAVKERK